MNGYIEREAVMQKFADHVKRSNNSDFAAVPTWNQAVQIVEDYPAADVVPVVHGHWRGEYDGYADGNPCYDMWYCSECDYYVEDDRYPEYKYCPNCGAKMDEDEVEE